MWAMSSSDPSDALSWQEEVLLSLFVVRRSLAIGSCLVNLGVDGEFLDSSDSLPLLQRLFDRLLIRGATTTPILDQNPTRAAQIPIRPYEEKAFHKTLEMLEKINLVILNTFTVQFEGDTLKTLDMHNIKNRLRGKVGKGEIAIRQELKRLMAELPPSAIPSVYKSSQVIAPAIMKRLIPQRRDGYNKFFPVLASSPASGVAELTWALCVVMEHTNEINSFIEYREGIERQVMAGAYEEALVSLEVMEKNLGKSLWGIELKFALTQQSSGLKANKDLLKAISSELKQPLTLYLIHNISIRNEEKSTAGGFYKNIKGYVQKYKLPDFISSYFEYRLLGQLPETEEGIAAILSIDKYASVIDCYESLIKALTLVAVYPSNYTNCIKSLFPLLKKLDPIEDSRIQLLKSIYSSSPSYGADTSSSKVTAWSLYTDARKQALPLPNNKVVGLESLLVSDLRAIICRSKNRDKNIELLLKRLLNFGSLSIALPMSALVFRKFSLSESNWLLPPLFVFSALNCTPVMADVAKKEGPWSTEQIDAKLEQSYTQRYQNGFGSDYQPAMDQLQLVYKDLTRDQYTSAMQLAEDVKVEGCDQDMLWESRRALIHTYVFNDDIERSYELIAECCAEDTMFQHELPIEILLNGKKWRDIKCFSLKHLAMCLYLYCGQNHDDNALFNLRQCVAGMYKTGLKGLIATQVAQGKGISRLEMEILKNIFIQDNMIFVTMFKSSEQLAQERLSICQILLTVDPSNSESYEAEIKDIAFEAALNVGMQKVDQSRVFVDIPGLKRWSEKEHKEAYNRWMELTAIDTVPLPDLRLIVSKIYENANILPPELLVKPESQADQLLMQMLSSLLEKFLNDPKDGLNGYLSLRVRHGSLEGFLRSPLNDEGLIAVYEQDLRKYVLSDKIHSDLMWHCAHLIESLEVIFGRFSETLTTIFDEFINRKLRIRSEQYPEGLIDVNMTNTVFNLIKMDLTEGVSFDKLLDVAFAQFGVWTDASLEMVRNELRCHVHDEVRKAIETLRFQLSALSDNANIAFINDNINRGYLAFQLALEKASGWFNFNIIEDHSRTFSMEEVINIAIQMTKNVCPGFEPQIKLDLEGAYPPLTSQTLTTITDILLIMLGNVNKHSGLKNNVEIILNVRLDNELLVVTVENEVESGIDNEVNNVKLQDIRNKIIRGEHINVLSTEGNSGLIKLSRYIPGDHCDVSKYLNFGFSGENRFIVSMGMPFFVVPATELV